MPFDEEEPRAPVKGAIGVKQMGKSIFDKKPKKPKQSEFSEKAFDIEENRSVSITNFHEAAQEISKLFKDKTLPQNKHRFSVSLENEIIQKFIDLCAKKNDDENADFNGEGSLSAFSLLIKLCLMQKDRINVLEKSVQDMQILQNKNTNNDEKF